MCLGKGDKDMNDDLYKEDKYFIELLNSGDRKRQCEYRNALIKAILSLKEADKDNRISEEIWNMIRRHDSTVRALIKVLRLFTILNTIMLVDVITFICIRVYLLSCYNTGTLTARGIELFATYCGDGSAKRLAIRGVALMLLSIYTLMARRMLLNASNDQYDYIVKVQVESDFDDEINDSISGNSLRTLIAKRDALDGVLWGG